MESAQRIDIKDRSGSSIKTIQIGDYVFWHPYPSKISKRLDNGLGLNDIENEEFFDDDILLVSYARSGYHWTLEMVHMLVQGNTEYDKLTAVARIIELRPGELIPENFNDIRPRILQTHLPFFMLPEKLRKLRMIFVYRNPKDIAYSFYNLTVDVKATGYDGRFEDYLLLFQEGRVPLGDYFRYMNSWEPFIRENKKCCLSYEQLKEDPLRVLRMVSDYLGIKADKAFLEEIIEKCSLQNMKKNKTLSPYEIKDGKVGFLRKGEIGDWKNHFTVAMSEEFDRVLARRMPNTQLEFQFEPRKL